MRSAFGNDEVMSCAMSDRFNLNISDHSPDNSLSASSGELSVPKRRKSSTRLDTLEAEVIQDLENTNPYDQLGLSSFNIALYPEGEEMQAYNSTKPNSKYQLSRFTSKEAAENGSAQVILQDYVKSIHPTDVPDMADFIMTHLKLAAEWDLPVGESRNNVAQQFRAKLPEDNGDDESTYRWQELRTRMTQLDNGLIICDGAFLDITDLKEREQQLEDKAAALEREIGHHKFTQAALEEAMDDIREARAQQRRRLKEEERREERKQRLDVEEMLEDVESVMSLIEGSTFAQKRWAKNILKGLSSKLKECLNENDGANEDHDDDVSEVTWNKP